MKDYKKLIIIGAARSGTNMLRDVLTKKKEFSTWPCDEINYIWRYGNKHVSHDELNESHIDEKNKKYINNAFDKINKKYKTEYTVEKTCANSLRVNFVENILHKPLYINIVRDPVDVVASAKKRWKAELDIPYILKKARYVPVKDLPYYGFRYIKNRINKLFNNDDTLSYWGPQLKGMNDIISKSSIEEICAYQWEASVRKSYEDLKNIDKNRVYKIRYIDFVRNPDEELKKLFDFYNINYSENEIAKLTQDVHPGSLGKGYKQLEEKEIEKVKKITEKTYKKAFGNEQI